MKPTIKIVSDGLIANTRVLINGEHPAGLVLNRIWLEPGEDLVRVWMEADGAGMEIEGKLEDGPPLAREVIVLEQKVGELTAQVERLADLLDEMTRPGEER